MPIFISHSHQDKDFVDVLATNLIQRRQHVWVDRWELKVGDSLINRIQSAITTASALIVVLSKASVASEWCKKELSAGLIRELEERRVIVLPLLLEDCDIPLFLRDKMYADFRKDFDAGLNEIQKTVASLSSHRGGLKNQIFIWTGGLLGEKEMANMSITSGSFPMAKRFPTVPSQKS